MSKPINITKDQKHMNQDQQQTGLGKYAGMHGTIFKSDVGTGKPVRGVVGKGMPQTCNAVITEKMSARSLREYQRQQAIECGDLVPEDDTNGEAVVDELDGDSGDTAIGTEADAAA